ncbi:MAG: V-type ATP synthase subunit K [Candidatus ainarchaeum sp.]|nr:V-type ATP synthase subunit K [Candidatus ainarchaeum sp.]
MVADVAGAINSGLIAIGAAIAIAGAAIAAAWAEKEIGTAAVGAMAEKPELFVSGLILTVIPETIVIFGLVIAYLIVQIAA